MNERDFANDLKAFKARVDAWNGSDESRPAAVRLAEADEELNRALEELQVVDEELARQNRALELARQAMDVERRRYQDLFQFAPDGYLVTDLDGTVFEANRAAARLLGVPEQFLRGKPLAVFVAPEDRRAFRAELMHRLGETSRVEEMLVHLRPREGPAFRAALTVGVIADRDGAPSGLRWLVRDVSQRPAESSLRTRVEELTDADRRKDEFLAMLAHELRNPLAPLAVAVQLLRRCGAGAVSATTAHALDTADHQIQKLSRLVEELLDVSRIRQGKADFRPERVALEAVTAAAVETVRPLIEERRHALEVSLPAPPVVLEADPGRLEQVLTNLLTNAAKYTEPGGRITLRGERDGPILVIRVRDTGVGLAAELLPRLFEPFVQSEPNGRRSRGGLGLGLSLVKRFVTMHGGSVEARSDGPGRGSEFVVRLPAPSPEAEAPSRPAAVLIVEDNRDAADSLAEVVHLWGFRAITAYDGASALAAARQDPPDVALIDLALPDMDGCEVLGRLRGELGLAPLAVAVTGFAGEDDHARTRQAGFARRMVKPVDLNELKSLLARAPARQN